MSVVCGTCLRVCRNMLFLVYFCGPTTINLRGNSMDKLHKKSRKNIIVATLAYTVFVALFVMFGWGSKIVHPLDAYGLHWGLQLWLPIFAMFLWFMSAPKNLNHYQINSALALTTLTMTLAVMVCTLNRGKILSLEEFFLTLGMIWVWMFITNIQQRNFHKFDLPDLVNQTFIAMIMGIGVGIAFTAFYNAFVGMVAWVTMFMLHFGVSILLLWLAGYLTPRMDD